PSSARARASPVHAYTRGGALRAAVVIDEGGRLSVRGAHAGPLVTLQRLALRLQRRRYHHLGAVELRQVLVPACRHRGAQATEQVEGAIVLPRGAHEDLLQRAVLGRR